MGIPLQTKSYYDNGGGLDLKSSPTKTSEDDATASLNMEYGVDGAFYTRNGSSIVNKVLGIPTPMAQLIGRGLYDYKKSDGTEVRIVQNGSVIYQGFTPPVAAVNGLNALAFPDMEFQVTGDDEYLFWGNGVDNNLKFNGTTWTNWSIANGVAPVAPVAADFAAGLLGAGDYKYYVSFARTVGGVIVQEGPLSPVSNTLTIGANREIQVTIPVSTDTQVNARVIYRISPTSIGVAYRLATVADNVTLTYLDNTVANGIIEADFDNAGAPKTAIFETYLGRMYMVPASDKATVLYSVVNKPWDVPIENELLFDGPVQGIWKAYGALMFGTDKSLWVLLGDADTNDPLQVSHRIGIINNRCAVGDGVIYIWATNRKFYTISPTDFSQKEIRIDEPASIRIEPLINQVGAASSELLALEYYTNTNEGKVLATCPITAITNNSLIVFNETQSFQKNKPCWHLWDNINASVIKTFTINGQTNPYSTDYNGYIWKLDDTTTNGDGAEVNGTVTSATPTVITDATQSWTVNAYKGVRAHFISGPGVDESEVVVSNTATTFTLASALTTTPTNITTYTLGGYDAYHYTNWKSVTGSYDTLKQLWYFFSNLNASGDYTIELIIQYDFDTTTTNQTVLNINLQAANSIWGQFIWGQATWGAFAVFQDRIRQYGRFRAVRFAFRNRKAGQPFQVNGFSVSVQDKGLFYGAAA